MIPELGHFSLILALVLSFFQGFLPCCTLRRACSLKDKYFWVTKPLTIGVSFFISLSFLLLLFSFANDDFSVNYVAHHSNSALPFHYKLSALWAGHEGSLLLWVLLLSYWMLAFNLSSKLPIHFQGKVLGCCAFVIFGFLLFLVMTSNPFLRILPEVPLDGLDLNPLLQDPGLIFHPPLLYMGYVGSALVAAFACAALWENRIDPHFASAVRPWVLASFGFLTLGIAWGSFWAYYELGWGGFWFWDPVENTSFIPWLTMLALVHCLIVVKKRKILYGWTLLLMIAGFALSLLASVLLRSSMLSSVHSFAADPTRGIFMSLLFSVLMGGALLLYVYRYKTSTIFPKDSFHLSSREALILLNSIMIMVSAFAILLGTLFPVIYEAFKHQKISVGFPYFNLVFIPLMIPVLFSVPLGPWLHWGNTEWNQIVKKLGLAFILSAVTALFLPLVFLPFVLGMRPTNISNSSSYLYLFLGLFCAFWIGFGTIARFIQKIKQGGILNISVNAWGMLIAHFGVAVLVLGVTVVSNYQIEKEIRLSPLESISLQDYQIKFIKIEKVEGDNFVGFKGYFTVESNDIILSELVPEKRNFIMQNSMVSETAIYAGFWGDVYIALGEPLEQNAWSIRIYYKPLVRWIWAGAVMVFFACFILVVFRKKKG